MKTMKNILTKMFSPIGVTFLLFLTSCESFVEVAPPKTSLTSNVIFNEEATAVAAVTFMMHQLWEDAYRYPRYLGTSSDEFTELSTNMDAIQFYNNNLISGSSIVKSIWADSYASIYQANAAIEGLSNSWLTPEKKAQLIGEAKFIREYWYFYLTNLFGDVPLITSTDYAKNSVVSRTSANLVFEQIKSDLIEAESLLSEDYVTTERVRANKASSSALLARVYLYTKNWDNAEAEASKVIINSKYSLVSDLNKVFLKNSSEAILQIMPSPTNTDRNTAEGREFIFDSTPRQISLTEDLLNAFEVNDQRRTAWIGRFNDGVNDYYFPHKYKVKSAETVTEYSTLLRLAELYLIRAESRAQQGNIEEGQADLNFIRNRAGLPNKVVTSKDDLLLAIEQERRAEFFTEWGHRWLDLKRNNRTDEILGLIKPEWKPTSVLLPIPASDIESNPNLKQNTGY